MNDFYKEVLIKLKRKYGKDDLVRALMSQIENLKKELDELDYNFEERLKIMVKQKTENLKICNKYLSKQNSELRKTNSYLITQLNNERNKNRELKKDSV